MGLRQSFLRVATGRCYWPVDYNLLMRTVIRTPSHLASHLAVRRYGKNVHCPYAERERL